MCEFCDTDNTEDALIGSEGIVQGDNSFYLYLEWYRNEKYRVDVKYCPMCGRKLCTSST